MILFVLICFFLILVVLLQQGKGADVSAAFGGASNPQSFGPRGTTTPHRASARSSSGCSMPTAEKVIWQRRHS